MKKLIKPNRLHVGDTVATISISGGRAGDNDLLWRYQLGKKRLEDVFGLKVIETPNALKGTDFLYASGVFSFAKGLITTKLNAEEKEMLLRFLKYEVGREDMPVLTNMDFGHRTPMTVFPMGAMAEINCDKKTFSILESGVV